MPFLLAAEPASHSSGLDLLIIFAAAAAVALLFSRLRLATVAAYLVTGAVIGPYALGLVREFESVEAIADLAIIVLLFLIGMHLDITGPRGGIVAAVFVGGISTLLSILLGWPVAMLLGLPAPAALAVALAASMSSTAVVMKTLTQRRELHQPHGRLAFGILLVQDLAAVVMLGVMPVIAAWHTAALGPEAGGGGDALPPLGGLVLRGLGALAAITAMLLVGRFWLPHLLRYAAGQSAEVLLVVSGAVALGAATATSVLGLSPELGAFMGGLMLAATPFRHQLAGQLMPLRDLLIAVFFTVVGMKVNVQPILDDWWVFLLLLVLAVPARLLAIGATAWVAGATGPVAFTTAMALANGSEFGFIVLASARDNGILDRETTAWVGALLVGTLVAAPGVYELGRRLAPRLGWFPLFPGGKNSALRQAAAAISQSAAPLPAATGPAPRHIIIAGYGIVGRTLAERLQRQDVPIVIIELNPITVQKQSKLGHRVVYGDVTNPEVLESAGIHEAQAIVITIPDDEATLRACGVVREMAPEVFIAVRTSYLSRAFQATSLGADHFTVEEVATAEAMAREVMSMMRFRWGASRPPEVRRPQPPDSRPI